MKFLSRPTPDFPGYLNELFKWVEAAITSWTPVLTFATAGDLSVVYSTQVGRYILFGPLVIYWFNIVTSTFTHTTAAGNLQITGLPYSSVNITALQNIGPLDFQGITLANYTNFTNRVAPNGSTITITACGSAQNLANLTATETTSGTQVTLRGFGVYFRA